MDSAKPARRRFQSAADRPAADVVARQMEATTYAYRQLGSVEAVRRFLNDPDDSLGGRPLDIAGESSAGLDRVRTALTHTTSHIQV